MSRFSVAMKSHIIKGFASEKEVEELLSIYEAHRDDDNSFAAYENGDLIYGRPCGARTPTQINITRKTKVAQEITERIVDICEKSGIEFQLAPGGQVSPSGMMKGASLAMHSDSLEGIPEGHELIRTNVCVRQSERGGKLFSLIGDGVKKTIEISPGDLMFFNGSDPHGVTEVRGNSERVMCLFYISAPKGSYSKLYKFLKETYCD